MERRRHLATMAFGSERRGVAHSRHAMLLRSINMHTAWNKWTNHKESGSTICKALTAGRAKTVRENTECMRAAVESLSFTAHQGLAQSGDIKMTRLSIRETSLNSYISLANSNKFHKISAKYTHGEIQNEPAEVMADMIRDQISSDVTALMADESMYLWCSAA